MFLKGKQSQRTADRDLSGLTKLVPISTIQNGSSCRQALVNVIYRSGTLERWAYHEDTSTRGGRRDGLAGWELSSSERHFSGGQIWYERDQNFYPSRKFGGHLNSCQSK